MLSERLKKETQQAHINLEKLIIPQIKNVQTTKDYAQLLELFYGYHKPVEEALSNHISSNHLADYAERRKAEAIREDLEHIGAAKIEIPLCKEIPAVTSLLAALGVMYVLEGSTLGGKIISKMIMNNLQLESLDGVRFFSGYGSATLEKWLLFRKFLDNYTTESKEQDQIIATANETFIKFKNWIEAN